MPVVILRGRARKGPPDADGFRRFFAAENVWGVAAVLWLSTGLLRAFGGLEKGTQFYLHSRLFSLFAAILVREVWPMQTFIRWRIQRGRGQAPDTSRAGVFYVLNHLEMGRVVVIVFVAPSWRAGWGQAKEGT